MTVANFEQTRMSANFADYTDEANADFEHYHSYKAVSALAVVSLGLGLLSVLTFLEWIFVAVPLLGLVLGFAACRQIRLRQHELTGLPVAGAGVILSAAMLLGGSAWHVYVYKTEVPEGYTRVHYDLFRPQPGDPGEAVDVRAAGGEKTQITLPSDIVALNNQKVFVKGYMYPSQHRTVKEFVLCRDNKDCCFGGQPSWTDMILVTMKNPPKAEFTTWQRKVGGTLRVMPAQRNADEGVVHQIIYQLEADYLP